MARLCRLLAFLRHNESKNSLLESFARVLEPGDKSEASVSQELDSADIALFLSRAPKMEENEYNKILQYLISMGHPYYSWTNLPRPEFAYVLPPNAKRLNEFHDNGHTYSCYASHNGNSAIQFWDPHSQAHITGAIQTILEIPLEGFLRKFILVHSHSALCDSDITCTPYPQYPRMMCKVVDAQLSDELYVLEPQHIITHLTTLKYPPGTFGILKETLGICWALNRGLR